MMLALIPRPQAGSTLPPALRGSISVLRVVRVAHAYCNHQRRNRVSNLGGKRMARKLASRVQVYQRKRRYRVGATP